MLVVPNHVYDFAFNLTLNIWDGIYQVGSLMSYADTVASDIDLFALTYQTNGINEDVFNTDLDKIRSGKIVKIISVDDETIIRYIPDYLFKKVPDGSVQKYLHLGLAIDLGTFNDAELLSTVRSEVEQITASMVGSTNKTVIYTVDSKWMTSAEYTAIDTARKAAITKVTNHYTDKLELIKQIDNLKTLIGYYEDILKRNNQ